MLDFIVNHKWVTHFVLVKNSNPSSREVCLNQPGVIDRSRGTFTCPADASKEGNGDEPKKRRAFLLGLLRWFKSDFFSWVDKPKCHCGGTTASIGKANATPEEAANGVRDVELYKCETCGNMNVRFPRYNNPGKLLETRQGRCGEWANCFHLLVKSFGYDVRHAHDWTDHVWIEVVCPVDNRWMHMDPCECAFDRPYLYESGWGKKLTYVIAVCADGVQDVTWRYTKDHAAVLARRHEIKEVDLVNFQTNFNREVQLRLSPERRAALLQLLMKDLASFLLPRQGVKESEAQGRVTGSEQWRRERGELGTCASNSSMKQKQEPHTCSLSDEDLAKGEFLFTYDVVNNFFMCNGSAVKSCSMFSHKMENIERKLEVHWNQVYLARKEGSDSQDIGSISWEFDLSRAKEIKRVEIRAKTATFENGKVTALLCSDETCLMLFSLDGSPNVFGPDELQASKVFELKFTLSGGSGEHAFQHAQLFRSEFAPSSDHEPQLEFKVQFS